MSGGFSFAIAALCALAAADSAPPAAASLEFTVTFDCLQTTATNIPTAKALKFRFDPMTGATSSPEFDQILADAAAYPYVDFFKCMQSMSESIPGAAWSLCEAQKEKTGICALKRREFSSKVDKKLEPIATYGQGALAKGAVPPFDPARPAVPALNDYRRASIAATIEAWCGAPSLDYLDETVLTKTLPGVVKKLKNCSKAELAHNYLDLLKSTDLSQAACAANVDACAVRRGHIRHALQLLAASGLGDVLSDPALLAAQNPECKTDDTLESAMGAAFLRTDKLAACTKQKENDPAGQILGNDGRSRTGTGLYPQYKLNRREDVALSEDYVRLDGSVVAAGTKVPKFEASVKFRFTPENADDSKISAADLQEKYARRARDCYGAEPAASRLRGPDGELLKIILIDPESDPHKADPSGPPTREISIPSGNVRSNSGLWTPNIGCDVIVHETLHVLGLVDEYAETSDGALVAPDGKVSFVDGIESMGESKGKTFTKYDCRVIGPANSIMSSEASAYGIFSPSWTIKMCNCDSYGGKDKPKPAKDCKKRLKAAKPGITECPAGTVRFSPDPDWGEDVTKSRLGPDATKRFWNDELILGAAPKKPARSSLLYPAQFRAITQPGCVDANKAYFVCAREAYKTSRASYGGETCAAGLPPECRKSVPNMPRWKMSDEQKKKWDEKAAA
ncbi:MAG: hypothetical protein HY075_06690, partial [Deltaproteobacteria bacterium]|nr:hypothetical protein [Deltaproteobacteria bacterium]